MTFAFTTNKDVHSKYCVSGAPEAGVVMNKVTLKHPNDIQYPSKNWATKITELTGLSVARVRKK